VRACVRACLLQRPVGVANVCPEGNYFLWVGAKIRNSAVRHTAMTEPYKILNHRIHKMTDAFTPNGRLKANSEY
jgi:hypothetical protein